MKKVYALYRVSTDKQGTEDEIPMQKAECHKYARKQGWIITKEYTEKVSGFQVPLADRNELFEILDDAKASLFDILLVYNSDRLGRQTDFFPYYGQLEQAGVQAWSTKEGRISGEEHADILKQFIGLWMAEGESRKTSARVRDSMTQMFEAGEYVTGNAAFGYKLVDTGVKRNPHKPNTLKKIVIDDEEAETVKLIFNLAGNKGWGTPKIAKYLNENNVHNRSGKIWRSSTIYRFFRSTIYIGYRPYHRTEKVSMKSKDRKSLSYKDWKHQPYNEELVIIKEDLFNKVQELTTNRGHEKKTDVPLNSMVLLSGISYCGDCGSKMRTDFSYSHKRKDGSQTKLFRYRCQSSRDLTHEGQSTYSAKKVDNAVSEMIKFAIQNVNAENLKNEINQFKSNEVDIKQKQINTLKKEKVKIQNGLKKAENEMEKVFLGESNFKDVQIVNMLESFNNKLVNFVNEIKKLEQELNHSELTQFELESFMNKLNGWDTIFEESDLDTQKIMLGDLIEKVVFESGTIKLYYKGSYEAILGIV